MTSLLSSGHPPEGARDMSNSRSTVVSEPQSERLGTTPVPPGKYRVSMSAPDILPEDIRLVTEVLQSKTLCLGPFLSEFERAFADFVGTSHAVGVANGTAGLHLCILAANIADGDEVITTPFSFVASANCILYERARPVFVDIDEVSMNLDPELARRAVTERTRAVLPVHVFGQPCAMTELHELCRERDLLLIEDACEAVGAEYRGRKVGTFGKAAVFSFYPNKQMTTGEGAVITTNDPAWATLLRSLRNQGRDELSTWLVHERLGYNYRLDEMSAALGFSQLRRIETLLALRRRAIHRVAAWNSRRRRIARGSFDIAAELVRLHRPTAAGHRPRPGHFRAGEKTGSVPRLLHTDPSATVLSSDLRF
jgi:perosamine synthetase